MRTQCQRSTLRDEIELTLEHSNFLFSRIPSISHLGNVDSRPVSRGNTTSQEAHAVKWGIWMDLGQVGFQDDGVLGEGADAEELEDLLPPTGDPTRAVS